MSAADDDQFPWRKRTAPRLMALEPRMLFDGAAAAVVVGAADADQKSAIHSEIAGESANPLLAANEIQLPQYQPSIADVPQAPSQLVFQPDNSQLDSEVSQVWSAALLQTQQQLIDFARSDQFQSVLQKIYNPACQDVEAFDARIEQLRQDILGDGLNIAVELRSSSELTGYLAAYAAVGEDGAEKIYVNREWVNFGLGQSMVGRALLEEIGHAIDRRLNGVRDTLGDEGEYFERAVNQDVLSAQDIQQLTAEDDSGMALIDGQYIAVEHATITFVKAYQGMNSTYTAVGTTYGIQTTPI